MDPLPSPVDDPAANIVLPSGLIPAACELGSPTAAFVVDRRRTGRRFLVMLLLVALGTALAALGAWILVSVPQEKLGITCLGFGLAILLAAVMDWWKVWTHRGTRVFVCPLGLIHLQDGETTVVRWADVTELRITGFHGRTGGHTRTTLLNNCTSLSLTCTGRPSLELGSYLPNIERLARACQEATLVFLLPPILERLVAGKEVRFGLVRVNRQRMGDISKKIAWEEIRAIRAEAVKSSNSLAIYERNKGRFLDIPFEVGNIYEIPNLHVLWAIADRLRGVDTEKSAEEWTEEGQAAEARARLAWRRFWICLGVPTAVLVIATIVALLKAGAQGWAVGVLVAAFMVQVIASPVAAILFLFEARRQERKAATARAGGGEEMPSMQEALRTMPYAVLILLFVMWPFMVVGALMWLLS